MLIHKVIKILDNQIFCSTRQSQYVMVVICYTAFCHYSVFFVLYHVFIMVPIIVF